MANVSIIPTESTMDVFSKLPDELLLAIFMHIEHPNSFSRTNKRFHGIACNTLNIVRWLKARYYENEMIYYALLNLGDRSEPVCEVSWDALSFPDKMQCSYLIFRYYCNGQPPIQIVCFSI
jgi:hypothetical protein